MVTWTIPIHVQHIIIHITNVHYTFHKYRLAEVNIISYSPGVLPGVALAAEVGGYTLGTLAASSLPLIDNFLPPTKLIRGGVGVTVTVLVVDSDVDEFTGAITWYVGGTGLPNLWCNLATWYNNFYAYCILINNTNLLMLGTTKVGLNGILTSTHHITQVTPICCDINRSWAGTCSLFLVSLSL